MKSLKSDNKYEYYELSNKEQEMYVYYSSEVIAINKRNIYTYGLENCIRNGKALPCSYSFLPLPKDPFLPIYVDVDSIVIDKDYLEFEK